MTISEVLKGDYCVGCGACTLVVGSPYQLTQGVDGQWLAVGDSRSGRSDVLTASCDAVCPFAGQGSDEDALALEVFPPDLRTHAATGRYVSNWVGYVADSDTRAAASSGGMARWLLKTLLEQGEVDAVLAVGVNSDGWRPQYRLFKTPEALCGGVVKSSYVQTPISEGLSLLEGFEGKVAITAIPCQVKALRQLARQDPDLRNKIRYILGIICGHMKTPQYAESLAWQLGHQSDLNRVDFRSVELANTARDKCFEVQSAVGRSVSLTKELVGGDYNLNCFSLKACSFCDDVTGELADVSVGDAWLPGWAEDPRGASVVVVRSARIDDFIRHAVNTDIVNAEEVSPAVIGQSQRGGLQHRREGLSYRLWLAGRRGEWVPPKRVRAKRLLSAYRRNIYEWREALAVQSREAFRSARSKGDLNYYLATMKPYIRAYRVAQRPPLVRRIWLRLMRSIPTIQRKK